MLQGLPHWERRGWGRLALHQAVLHRVESHRVESHREALHQQARLPVLPEVWRMVADLQPEFLGEEHRAWQVLGSQGLVFEPRGTSKRGNTIGTHRASKS